MKFMSAEHWWSYFVRQSLTLDTAIIATVQKIPYFNQKYNVNERE